MSRLLLDAPPWWRRLGALLPPEVRERVYEPCCYDRLRGGLLDRRHVVPFPAYTVGVLLGVVGLNLPGVLRNGWRNSRLARVAALVILALASLYVVALVGYATY